MAQRNVPPNFKSFFESVTIDASGSLIVSTLSASYASSSGAGFPYIGNAEITGSLDISQNLIVKGNATFRNAIIISSSTLYDSGSTKFGDSPDDTHQFTGSLLVSGSQRVNNDITLGGNQYFGSDIRWVPTQSAQGPGLGIELFISGTYVQLGYFAQ
jgi:hypothetical protein